MELISVPWFYILPTLLNSYMSSSKLEWSLLDFPCRISSAKSGSLISSLPIWMPLISFCCLVAEGRTSSTMLNSSGESGHSYRVTDLEEKLSVFPHWEWYSLWVFMMLMYVPSIPTLKSFNQEKMLYFVKCFFCISWEYHMVLVLFIYVVYHIDWFVDVEPPLQPRNKSHLVMVNNPFNVLLDPIG